MTFSRLRGSDLSRPYRGVRARTEAADPAARAEAYLPKLRAGEHFSHATAIALAGGWIPDRLRTEVDVSAIRPTGRARGAGVRGHEAREHAHHLISGLPCVDAASAWCQAASLLRERELVVAADSLLRRQRPVLSLDDLRDAVARRAGTRHIAALRRALLRARERTDSVAETLLRLDAADAGLPEFAVNEEIRDARGRFLACGDLMHASTKVLLEYDGQQHRLDDRQYARDVERLDALAAAGWRVIRINRSHRGADRSRALERVRVALTERGWRP
ncbi:DUF559 domain-containing protein [Microbacterium sp. EYE_5]|uniref:DUF559 domain-containing protein n=1 Tax=unclassified Microbacterium TaxID=2609290 RepID=UPI0020067B1D|nr:MULTISPECIES: DUF559 domain-containing protein [unclassified Microbacterium]MCK6079354.1 DUF559 domain-containing protein [Microbacterium sp. EYE_382]MCK6084624.1 DUF559 domain-containing protein [Microbacterium sp. EYE_384]MCK6123147.1 DUF559 domain-containing protein [Microbacterium sp. EYE_80]MCK6125388.1 DUF559 domain-containing protein [Microbacterium sp. EYE_79]MCK6140308.1 DUF559 domain-containing protein [Microbacterium sp. EYE_39]